MGVRDGVAANFHVLVRGDVKEKGPDVPRGGPMVLKTGALMKVKPSESGRLELAQWMVRDDNPLTARVMVNRIWQYLFGQGFVETPDNFGALGDAPSNQELLDTLAVQFMTEKWSIKQLIRSIMLSRVYQLSSRYNEANYAKDPSNRLLWRMDRRRLDAEEIRDAILAVSGQLDLNRPEGSPVMDMEGQVGKKGKKADKGQGKPEQSLVRSVYLPMIRGNVPPALAAFDMADPNLIVAKRDVTNVATQALFMMNSPFVLQQSAQMAKRVLSDADLKQPARIDLAYRLALGRLPSEKERSRIEGFLKDYLQSLEQAGHTDGSRFAAWSAVCQTLLASAEFRYLY